MPDTKKREFAVRSFTSSEEDIARVAIANRPFVIKFEDGQILEIELYSTVLAAGLYKFSGKVKDSGKTVSGFYGNMDGSKRMMAGYGMIRSIDEL